MNRRLALLAGSLAAVGLALVSAQNITPKNPDRYTIAIDAGHGGWDPGTVNRYTGLQEKSVTLAISLDLQRLLSAAGFKTVMFRSDDTAHAPPGDVLLNLQRQVLLARPPNTLFVGIYVNSCPQYSCPGRGGPQSYYFGQPVDPDLLEAQLKGSGLATLGGITQAKMGLLVNVINQLNQAASRTLAADIEQGAVDTTQWPEAGITPAPLYVLRYAKIPAALIEVGYMTDREEGRLLAEETWQMKIARGITAGIVAFLNQPLAASRPIFPLSARSYTVVHGDTLFSLARRFHTRVATLMALNDLKSANLRIGQVLKLPAAGPGSNGGS